MAYKSGKYENTENMKFGKMLWDGFWAFEDLRLLNSNSMRKFSAITREEIYFGLRSGPGRPIYVF